MAFIATLASSSIGNSAVISDGRTNILIDAGISCRRIQKALAGFDLQLEDIDAVLITHEHSDHVRGLDILLKSHPCPVYLTGGTAWQLEQKLGLFDCHEIHAGEGFELGGMAVTPIATPHDAAESVGFLFELGGRRALYATDIGHVTPDIASAANCSECVFIESNHDIRMLLTGSYPEILKQRILSARGHLSNDDCSDLVAAAAQNGARRFTLCHLSGENNTPFTALETSRTALDNVGAVDVELTVAHKNDPSDPYIFPC